MDPNQTAAFFGGVYYTLFDHCRDLIVQFFGPNSHVDFDSITADDLEEISGLHAMVDPCIHRVDTMNVFGYIGGRYAVVFVGDFRFLPDGEDRRFVETFIVDFSRAPPLIESSVFRSGVVGPPPPPALFE
ncbi:uncharacterized protein LOC130138555 [Syzygium oleosum]|uniref:uncharacterized protein LOC115663181 n=1 Tax=Syzygium oleosum TaxID=219896 RepID=UPI0011D1A8BB|nr:uncharacterized protein LOC115663181 [Syzygium oleosum]XP_056168644.1 uncharacterized protein LOC130138468 [Syzygium oleosum]XP_056168646.1 uncharacterized protein LOC130138469 [Syzygium oleosum]XP_056168819.1 uncharacterized protein LOC130138555 [Syzygium oleosum]